MFHSYSKKKNLLFSLFFLNFINKKSIYKDIKVYIHLLSIIILYYFIEYIHKLPLHLHTTKFYHNINYYKNLLSNRKFYYFYFYFYSFLRTYAIVIIFKIIKIL